MSGDTVVLLARVVRDSGEGWGTGPARVQVEEGLYNTPADVKELEIDTAAGTSCYRRLQAGQRYVIFAYRPEGSKRLISGGCSGTFNVQGHENVLDAMRNQAKRGAPRLVGQVVNRTADYSSQRFVAGAVVTADSPSGHYTATTDGFGNFTLAGMNPDYYRISLARAGFVPDEEFNARSGLVVWSMGQPKPEPGVVQVTAGRCSVRDLGMWANGRLSGTVFSSAGRPLEGVTVQAFPFDKTGKADSSPYSDRSHKSGWEI